MAFEYVYPGQPLPGLQYPQPQQQAPQQGGSQISPGAMGGLSKLMGGGGSASSGGVSSAAGTAGGMSSAPASAGVSTGAGAGSGAGGAGTAGGSAVASAGPWAALAAIIVANEYSAVEGGYRKEDKRKYAKDVLDAEVFHQDIEKRWLPGLGIDEDSKTSKRISVMATPINPLNPKESFKRIKEMF